MTEQKVHEDISGDQPLIETRNLTKSFKEFEAIKPPGINLKIEPQEVLVIIGLSCFAKKSAYAGLFSFIHLRSSITNRN